MNTEKHENWIKTEQVVRSFEAGVAALEKRITEERELLAVAKEAAVAAGCEAAEEKSKDGFAAIMDLDGNLRAIERCRRKKGGEEPVHPFRVSERILKV